MPLWVVCFTYLSHFTRFVNYYLKFTSTHKNITIAKKPILIFFIKLHSAMGAFASCMSSKNRDPTDHEPYSIPDEPGETLPLLSFEYTFQQRILTKVF